jgi:3-methyladenine DNA glycosylase AlkD
MDIRERIIEDVNQLRVKKTKDYRAIAKSYKKEISHLDITDIYHLCESLLDIKKFAYTTIAYQIIFDSKNKFNEETFDVFQTWLYKYIDDWWDCDDFMTHAFQYVLMRYPENLYKIKSWVNHERFAVRRSAAVILIRPIQKGLLAEKIMFDICDLLLNDPHYLVQKGYGWLLKESSKHYLNSLIFYLETHVSQMSRTAFRYALEKLPINEKNRLMAIK